MANDPSTIFGLAEAGVKKVAPPLLVGGVLVVSVLWLWPDATAALAPGETGAALQALALGPDGGRAVLDEVSAPLGAPVQLSANVPFAATVAVFQVGPQGTVAPLWPPGGAEPMRSSAGKRVELPGQVVAPGPPGEQAWVLSMCQLGVQPPACLVKSASDVRCPEGCVTASMPAHVRAPP